MQIRMEILHGHFHHVIDFVSAAKFYNNPKCLSFIPVLRVGSYISSLQVRTENCCLSLS